MHPALPDATMIPMTARISTSRVLLVSDTRASRAPRKDPGGSVVRRYRIVRLRVDGRDPVAGTQPEHLKRLDD